MKKNKYLVLLVVAVILFNNCSDDDFKDQVADNRDPAQEMNLSNEEIDVLKNLSEGTKIELEEAALMALEAVGSYSGSNNLRSAKDRSIQDVTILSLSDDVVKTRTSEVDEALPDTVAYLFNFSDDGGYAVISADTRIPEAVLICSDVGSLTAEIENPAAAIFLEGTENYIANSIERANIERDSILLELENKLIAEDPDLANEVNSTKAYQTVVDRFKSFMFSVETIKKIHDWEFVERVTPMSTTEMDQNEPFNDLVPYQGCTSRPPAGCVAIATAQIMAYWNYPTNLNGRTINWAQLNQYTADEWRSGFYKNWVGEFNASHTPKSVRDDAAHIARTIGLNVGMNYSCSSSGAKTEKAVDYLKKLGYTTAPSFFVFDYKFDTVLASLKARCPVIASGYAKRKKKRFLGIKIYSTYSEGHAWVIDGFLTRRRLVEVDITMRNRKGKVLKRQYSRDYQYSTMFHMNWGWGGINNGYFAAGSFNSNRVDEQSYVVKSTSGESKNYQYNVRLFPYIRR